jgi:hypothetical protein
MSSPANPPPTPLPEIGFSPDIQHIPPESGQTTGVAGLILSLTAIPQLIKKIGKVFATGTIDAKVLIVHDIIKTPMKLLIGFTSAVSLLSAAAKVLTISIGVVMTPVALATCALLFAVCSTIYLSLELIRSILMIIQSERFMNKEEVGTVLKRIEILDNLTGQSKEHIIATLKKNNAILTKHLGKEALDDLMTATTNLGGALKKAQAILTYKKLDTLYKNYVAEKAPHPEVLGQRIGAFAAKTFADRVTNISHITLNDIKGMTEADLDTLTTQGKSLLKMVDRQTYKVLKVHILSLGVIAAASLSLIVSVKLLPLLSATAISVGISGVATALSLARSVAVDAFVDNTQKGVSLRLMIPRSFSPVNNERVWSIWRETDVKNKRLATVAKILYVIGSIISLGTLLLFDGAIYKAEWIKKARGDGADYDKNSQYDNMRVPLFKELLP